MDENTFKLSLFLLGYAYRWPKDTKLIFIKGRHCVRIAEKRTAKQTLVSTYYTHYISERKNFKTFDDCLEYIKNE